MILMPRYPVYVPTAGRHATPYTIRCLQKYNVPFFAVVQPGEVEEYAKVVPREQLITLPNDRQWTLVKTRNWIKEHAIAAGAARHWQLDDNMPAFYRWQKGRRIYCHAGVALRVCEDFSDRYENIAVSGLQYAMFAVNKSAPVLINHHVYSCSLINNTVPIRWRGYYNDDTDYCLQALAAGWCTALIHAFLVQKKRTMTVKGGNTVSYEGDGRRQMAMELVRRWPRTVTMKRRFNRPQHVVAHEWQKFDNALIRRKDIDWNALQGVNEYGLVLAEKSPVESAELAKFVKQEQERAAAYHG